MSPTQAAESAIERIIEKFPDFNGAVVALSKSGQYGAACLGYQEFPFSVGISGTVEV